MINYQKITSYISKNIDQDLGLKIENHFKYKLISILQLSQIQLYIAITLLIGSIGKLIYDSNLELTPSTITFILSFLFILSLFFSFKYSNLFEYSKTEMKRLNTDYIVLFLGLIFSILLGYLNYSFFKNIPSNYFILLSSLFSLFIAFRFDHEGVFAFSLAQLVSIFNINFSINIFQFSESINGFNYHFYNSIGSILAIASIGFFIYKLNLKRHFLTSVILYIFTIWQFSLFHEFINRFDNLISVLIAIILLISACSYTYYHFLIQKLYQYIYGMIISTISSIMFIVKLSDLIGFEHIYSLTFMTCTAIIVYAIILVIHAIKKFQK